MHSSVGWWIPVDFCPPFRRVVIVNGPSSVFVLVDFLEFYYDSSWKNLSLREVLVGIVVNWNELEWDGQYFVTVEDVERAKQLSVSSTEGS